MYQLTEAAALIGSEFWEWAAVTKPKAITALVSKRMECNFMGTLF
jgi:hypothetical protein